MSYTVKNFKTKKELKAAVDNYNKSPHSEVSLNDVLKIYPVKCYNPGLGADLSNYTGTVYLEGPHYPKPHTWYASGEMINGVLVKVK